MNTKVNLVDVLSSDNTIALYSKICFNKLYINDSDVDKQIKLLINNKHLTPFEFGEMIFYIQSSIACQRQMLQYRTAVRLSFSHRFNLPLEITGEVQPDIEEPYKLYSELLDKNHSREEARSVLPMCTTTRYYWKIDVRNLMHFLEERLDKHAQDEIRDVATKIEEHFSKSFPITYKYWKEQQ